MLASYTQIHKTVTEKQTHKFNFPLSVNLLALGEAVDYFLLGLARTAGPHLHTNVAARQRTSKSSKSYAQTHCVQTKTEFSQTGSDVTSCLQGDGGSC